MILQEQQAFLPNGGPYARLKRADGEKVSVTREEAIDMMRFLMDDASHIRKFPVPLAPDLAIFLAAKEDSYIPRDNIADVRHFWPGENDASLHSFLLLNRLHCIIAFSLAVTVSTCWCLRPKTLILADL